MAAKSATLETCPEAAEQPLSVEELTERRERVDRILRAVLAEPDAGFRATGVLYQEFVVRCRIEGLGSAVPDLSEFRPMLTSRPRRARCRSGGGRCLAGRRDPRLRAAGGRAGCVHDDRACREGGMALSKRCRYCPSLWLALVASRPASVDLHRRAGPHRLPARRRGPEDCDAGGACLGDSTRRPSCRGPTGAARLQQRASLMKRRRIMRKPLRIRP